MAGHSALLILTDKDVTLVRFEIGRCPKQPTLATPGGTGEANNLAIGRLKGHIPKIANGDLYQSKPAQNGPPAAQFRFFRPGKRSRTPSDRNRWAHAGYGR